MRVAAAVLLILAVPAVGQTGTAEEGAEIAARWCAACHADGTRRAGDAVPDFARIAQRYAGNAGALAGFLQAPHGGMPDLSLSRAEVEALVAWLLRPEAR
jgi:cytochrome c551/c552